MTAEASGQGARRGRRMRLIAGGSALVVLAAAAAGWQFLRSDDQLGAGPTIATFQIDPLDPKQPDFTASAVLIEEPGEQIEILRVRPLATSNVGYLGARSVWPRNRDSAIDGGPGFPTSSMLTHHPAIGAVISSAETGFRHPGEEVARPVRVLAGFRLLSGDEGAVFDVEVVYRADGKVKRQRSGTVFIVCTRPCKQSDTYRNLGEWEERLREQRGVEEIET